MTDIEDNTEKILKLEEFYDLIQNIKLQYKRPTLYNDELEIVPAYYKIKNENIENIRVLDYVYLQMLRGYIYNIDFDNKLIQLKYNSEDLLRYLDKLDDYNIQYIYNKRKSWISNETDTSIEDIMGSYSKVYNEENNYIVLDIHIENWDDLSIIDQYNNEINFKQLTKLSKSHSVGSILQYIGINFKDDEDSNEIQPLFYLRQLKIYTSKINFKNKCYIEDNYESEVEDIDINSDDESDDEVENEDEESNDVENEDEESNDVENEVEESNDVENNNKNKESNNVENKNKNEESNDVENNNKNKESNNVENNNNETIDNDNIEKTQCTKNKLSITKQIKQLKKTKQ